MPRKIGPVVKAARWVWRNRRQIAKAVITYAPGVGPVLQRGGRVVVDQLKRYRKVCVDCQKDVVNNPLAENKWCIARLGERCGLCSLKVDAFGRPIAPTAGH